ncbi:MAG: SagB/ThcOx family dehydrogenase [Pseudomonadota bacterium]
MPKVLWVALPLLLALVWLAGLAWRRRWPSRRAVNIVSSVLLLAYVAATAGLGIFWVANQQLPVFDWHYLFGYGTLLLLVLHLVFNLPVVWRFVVRQRPQPAPISTAAPSGRRPLLVGLGGAALASAVTFVLGWRLGRENGSTVTTGAVDAGLATIERFHAATAHHRGRPLRPAPGVDWGNAPAPFKRLAGAAHQPLPTPGGALPGETDLAALGDLLWHAAGVTETRGGLVLRASPSSGALFSTELYLIVVHWPGLAAGVWHHQAQDHLLERVGSFTSHPRAGARPSATLVATAVFGRTARKYGERTYRYLLADLGHLLENLRVVAQELQLPLRWQAGFTDHGFEAMLRLDPAEEGVLAAATLGPGEPAVRVGGEAEAAGLAGPPGLTGEIHAATRRLAPAPVERPAPAPGAAPHASPTRPLPRPTLLAPAWRPLIARRRSVRRYADEPVPLAALAALLLRMAAPPQLSAAVRIDVVAHAVASLPRGRYRYDALHHALRLRRTAATRAASRAAALEQDVIGDAAAVFVLSVDRAGFAADPLGPGRGYRHAFLEAGMVGERAYLEAAVQGLGVCAVGAFRDDEAAALVGLDPAREWPLHFIALGVPA